jgi:aspartate/methionine/tyrosine aminotransferase
LIRAARHMAEIAPFRVMQILGRARAMEAAGRDIVHMEIGEPDFASTRPVVEAAAAALARGQTHYTPAAGLPALREAIAAYYASRLGVEVDPARILVTPGASGALQLVLGTFVDPGDRVLLTDPGYPCNRHMVSLFGGVPVPLAVDAHNAYAVTPEALEEALVGGARALMLASPANPTGNLIDNRDLAELNTILRRADGALLLCDEIYQGLQYESPPATALALGQDNVVVINSFSKYFGMTGWRLGWLVAPEPLCEPMERLAQNIFLAAPTVAQHAALAAFADDNMALLEERRLVFRQRRDFLLAELRTLGFDIPHSPGGAFYLYAGLGGLGDDGLEFARRLLEEAGVAVTPGIDFGQHRAAGHVRFAYTTELARLETGIERLRLFLRAGG